MHLDESRDNEASQEVQPQANTVYNNPNAPQPTPPPPPQESIMNQQPIIPQFQLINPMLRHPSNANPHLCLSIFNCLCCCCLFGIIAIIYSVKTREYNEMSDAENARSSSKIACTLNGIGIAFGVIMILISIIVLVVFTNSIFNAFVNAITKG